jgi:hypothetical protein
VEQHGDPGVGERDRFADLGNGQRPTPVPVQVEHAESDGPDLEREGEGGRDAGPARSGSERRPPRVAVQREIGAEHRPTQPGRVHAGAFPQLELEVLHPLSVTAGGREDSCGAGRAHQREADAAHLGGLAAFLHEPVRPGRLRPGLDERRKDVGHPRSGHGLRPLLDIATVGGNRRKVNSCTPEQRRSNAVADLGRQFPGLRSPHRRTF